MSSPKYALPATPTLALISNRHSKADSGVKLPAALIPIRSLAERHRDQIIAHLLQLDESDRYLRFGFAATDDHVIRYVQGLNFANDEILGITNRKLSLIAMAHLAFVSRDRDAGYAEFGVSVTKAARGRGFGARLFERAVMDARNEGVSLMFIHALSENTAMLSIARNAGAKLERHGSETEAYLRLPPASLNSRLSEIVEDHYAQIDYRLKTQSRQFSDAIGMFKSLHCGWSPNRKSGD